MSEWPGHGRKRALRNLIYYLGICLLGGKATKSLKSQDFKPSFPIHEVGMSTIRLRHLTAKDRILAHVGNRTTLFKPVVNHSCLQLERRCFMHVFPSL